jgi:hypothetical protein
MKTNLEKFYGLIEQIKVGLRRDVEHRRTDMGLPLPRVALQANRGVISGPAEAPLSKVE